MKKYKIAYATGSRADYGIVRNYLKMLNSDEQITLSVLVTGAHLEEKYGNSVEVIKEDNFKIDAAIPISIESTKNSGIIRSMSIALAGFGEFFENNKYDLLIVLGDRYEIMAVAIAAAMQRIPILHLHGGEVTSGNYDEFIRHSVTKMSSYHFTGTEIYRNRVIQLGENPNRVYNLGALGAENCNNIKYDNVIDDVRQLETSKYWVVAFHPETLTGVSTSFQVGELLKAVSCISDSEKVVFIGTNADTDSDVIRKMCTQFVTDHSNAIYFENLNSDSYMYLLKKAIALIGNSSSGIIEAPSLGCFTVNIGNRQKGRVRGKSVIDVPCNEKDIFSAIQKVGELKKSNAVTDNPYFKENTAINYYKTTKKILSECNGVTKEFYDLK